MKVNKILICAFAFTSFSHETHGNITIINNTGKSWAYSWIGCITNVTQTSYDMNMIAAKPIPKGKSEHTLPCPNSILFVSDNNGRDKAIEIHDLDYYSQYDISMSLQDGNTYIIIKDNARDKMYGAKQIPHCKKQQDLVCKVCEKSYRLSPDKKTCTR